MKITALIPHYIYNSKRLTMFNKNRIFKILKHSEIKNRLAWVKVMLFILRFLPLKTQNDSCHLKIWTILDPSKYRMNLAISKCRTILPPLKCPHYTEWFFPPHNTKQFLTTQNTELFLPSQNIDRFLTFKNIERLFPSNSNRIFSLTQKSCAPEAQRIIYIFSFGRCSLHCTYERVPTWLPLVVATEPSSTPLDSGFRCSSVHCSPTRRKTSH